MRILASFSLSNSFLAMTLLLMASALVIIVTRRIARDHASQLRMSRDSYRLSPSQACRTSSSGPGEGGSGSGATVPTDSQSEEGTMTARRHIHCNCYSCDSNT